METLTTKRPVNLTTSLLKLLTVVLFWLPLSLVFSHSAQAKEFVLVIDPGHGGKYPGAIGCDKKTKEKDLNLAVALKLGKLFKDCKDVRVAYTRTTDETVKNAERPNIASKEKGDLYVSIHCNSADNDGKNPQGTEVLVMRECQLELDYAKKNDPDAKHLHDLMKQDLLERSALAGAIVQKHLTNRALRRERGVKQQENLWVLHHATMPAILIELGFMCTPSELEYLKSKEGQDTLAKALYQGLMEYINLQDDN